jgi:uncharacterized protein (TIRG00374 family)
LTSRRIQILGWLAATALLVFCLREVNGREVRDAMRLMDWRWIIIALLANAAILFAWTGLWWTVAPREERPTYSTMFEINAIASALMNTVPFLGGHAAALVLLVKRGGMTQHGALSVMALDQLGEGMAKVVTFALVAVSAPIPEWMRVGIGTACIAVATLLLFLMLAAHAHLHIRGPEGQQGMVARVRSFAAEWASRMETLRSARQSAAALMFAIGTKIAEGAGLLAVQLAFGVDLSVGATALVLAAVILGSMLPVAPGNVGTYEAAAFLAYRHLGIEPGGATLRAITGHLCFLIPSVAVGYLLGSARFAAAGAPTKGEG